VTDTIGIAHGLKQKEPTTFWRLGLQVERGERERTGGPFRKTSTGCP
jgi:hypothetical protein